MQAVSEDDLVKYNLDIILTEKDYDHRRDAIDFLHNIGTSDAAKALLVAMGRVYVDRDDRSTNMQLAGSLGHLTQFVGDELLSIVESRTEADNRRYWAAFALRVAVGWQLFDESLRLLEPSVTVIEQEQANSSVAGAIEIVEELWFSGCFREELVDVLPRLEKAFIRLDGCRIGSVDGRLKDLLRRIRDPREPKEIVHEENRLWNIRAKAEYAALDSST